MLERSEMTSLEHFDNLVEKTRLTKREVTSEDSSRLSETDLEIRDRCVEYLSHCRESDYYKTLENRMHQNQHLDKYELFYIIATSNNVNKIPVKVLEAANREWQADPLATNIKILTLLKNLKTAKSAKKRHHAAEELKTLFSSTPIDDTCNNCFINLRGFDFNFIFLKDLEITFADLTDAQFSHAFLCNTSISHCIADNINLSLGMNASKTITEKQNIEFISTSLQNSTLWQTNPDSSFDIAIVNCDLTSAKISIDNPGTINMHVSCCDLQSANLDLSKFKLDADSQENSFAGCSMIGTDFSGNALLKMVDVNNAKALNLEPESGFKMINCQLTLLHESIDLTRECATKNKVAQATIDEHVRAITFIASQNIIDHLQTKAPSERSELLEQVMQHPLFQPQSSWQQTINSGYQLADSFCSMFCKRNTGHAYFASPAMRELEQAKDEAILELGKHAKPH